MNGESVGAQNSRADDAFTHRSLLVVGEDIIKLNEKIAELDDPQQRVHVLAEDADAYANTISDKQALLVYELFERSWRIPYGKIGQLSLRFAVQKDALGMLAAERAGTNDALPGNDAETNHLVVPETPPHPVRPALKGRAQLVRREYDTAVRTGLDPAELLVKVDRWIRDADELFSVLGLAWHIPQVSPERHVENDEELVEREYRTRDEAILAISPLTKAVLRYAIDGKAFTMLQLRADVPEVAELSQAEYQEFSASFPTLIDTARFIFADSNDADASWYVTGNTSAKTYQLDTIIESYDDLVDGRGDPLYLNFSPETPTMQLTRTVITTVLDRVAKHAQGRNPTFDSLVAAVAKQEAMEPEHVKDFIDQLVREYKLAVSQKPGDRHRVGVTERGLKTVKD